MSTFHGELHVVPLILTVTVVACFFSPGDSWMLVALLGGGLTLYVAAKPLGDKDKIL